MAHISEKQLEDWICEHPETVMRDMKIIGRQIRLPHGILDLLGVNGLNVFIIELKAGPIKEAHIGQALRYTYDVHRIIYDLWWGIFEYLEGEIDYPPVVMGDVLDFFEKVEKRPRTLRLQLMHERVSEQSPSCFPILIGTSIDPNTSAALDGARGWVRLWHYDDVVKDIAIEAMPAPDELPQKPIVYPEWAQSTVREYLRGVVESVDRYEFDEIIESLFTAKKQ